MWHLCLILLAAVCCYKFLGRLFRKDRQLRDQVVLITGASGGLGTCLCKALAAEKCQLICVDVNEKSTEKLAEHIQRQFPNVAFKTYICDVSSSADVQKLASEVLVDFGYVDIIISNAAIIGAETLENFSDDHIRRTMEVNVLAQFWLTRAFFPSMQKREEGLFVAISSIGGIKGGPHIIPYCTSKFAITGFIDSLASELRVRKSKIRTLCVHPSLMRTGMVLNIPKTSMFTLTEPEDAAASIVAAMQSGQSTLYIPKHVQYLMIVINLLSEWFNPILDKTDPKDIIRPE